MTKKFAWQVAVRLAKEMSLPLIFALIVTVWNYVNSKDQTFFSSFASFCGFFFFFSWVPAQILRVIKQMRVEKNLDSIESKTIELLDRLKDSTDKMISHITGGSSFCYIKSASPGGSIVIDVQGEYCIYDLKIRIVDVEAFLLNPQNPSTYETFINIGEIAPGFERILSDRIQKGTSQNTMRRYNVFMFARNGYFQQRLRFAQNNENYSFATKVVKVDSGANLLGELYEYVSHDFPRNEHGMVNWD